MQEQVLKEEEFVDFDVEQIKDVEPETNLITKLNSPINILLIVLSVIVLIAIILVLIFL